MGGRGSFHSHLGATDGTEDDFLRRILCQPDSKGKGTSYWRLFYLLWSEDTTAKVRVGFLFIYSCVSRVSDVTKIFILLQMESGRRSLTVTELLYRRRGWSGASWCRESNPRRRGDDLPKRLTCRGHVFTYRTRWTELRGSSG